MLIIKILIFCILYVHLRVYAINVQIKLKGLDDALKSNVNEKLSGIRSKNINVDQYFQSKIINAISDGLRPLGYYSPKIQFFLYQSSSIYSYGKEDYVLLVQINPGHPVRVSKVNIISNGEICDDSDYKNLLLESKSYIGKILNHKKYDNFKNKLLNLSLSKGYFDFKFYKSELLVLPNCYESFWNIHFDSGFRYFFGKTTFHGGYIKQEYLKNLFNIQPGTYYDNNFLIEFNRRLYATNWFHSVVISQNFVINKNTKNIPIDVFLIPSMTDNFKISIGCSTDISGQLKMVWNRPCFNVYGHSFENIFTLSIPEQFIDLTYKVPLMRRPLYEYYLLQWGMRHDNIYNRKSNSIIKFNIARYWDSVTGWKRGVNLHCCYEYCNQLEYLQSRMLIYPGISIHRIQQKGGMMPVWGNSQHYSLDISNALWKSHANFFLLQSQNIWIRTLFYKHRLIIRNNFKWITYCNHRSIFPFLQRLFFVNDISIRGYKYQSLFLKNILLDSWIISSKLMITSLEYQYNFLGKWWGASFIDVGDFFKNVGDCSYWRCGSGFGIRWQSPIGPAKLDLAIPLFNKEGSKLLYVYIGLGPEL